MIDKERTMVNEDDRLKACSDIQRYLPEKMYPLPRLARVMKTSSSWRLRNTCSSGSALRLRCMR
jgi:hypothetical protein